MWHHLCLLHTPNEEPPESFLVGSALSNVCKSSKEIHSLLYINACFQLNHNCKPEFFQHNALTGNDETLTCKQNIIVSQLSLQSNRSPNKENRTYKFCFYKEFGFKWIASNVMLFRNDVEIGLRKLYWH